MSLNVNALAKGLTNAKIDINRAVEIINQTIFLIEIVEDAFQDLKGDEKLKAVVDGVLGLVRYVLPDAAEDFLSDLAKKLAPLISVIVSIYNIRNLWKAA